jgi:hypothetical protein
MNLDMMKIQNTKPIIKAAAWISILPLLCAWVSPVDLTEDVSGSASTNTLDLYLDTPVDSSTAVDRCDTADTDYTDNSLDIPTICHRWNLVWDAVTTGEVDAEVLAPQTDWVPNGEGTDWRLPTIKELTRIIDFAPKSADTLIESPVISDWFTGDDFWTTNTVGLGDGSIAVWLISSTFRDIDINTGDEENGAFGYAQVFAINILSGEIKTFEPGYKEVALGDAEINELRLCESLEDGGTCDYGEDATTNVVFALKVRTDLVEDLVP